MVSFQRWAGSADEDINLFLVDGKNYSWQLHKGYDGEIDGLGSKIGTKPPPPGYQMKAHISRQGLSIGVIIMRGFRCKILLC
jgi:hypothetical protein